MWPFGRMRPKTGATRAQPAPAPVVRRDWAALPPIQRTFGGHPLTAPSDRFSDDLATHHDPSVTTERMGHQISPEAPAGIVLSLAVPSTRSDGPAMIARPRVQRHAESAPAESGEWTGDEAAPIEARPTPVPHSVQRSAALERPAVAAIAEHPPLTTVATEPTPVASVPIQRRATGTPSTEWFAPLPTVAADSPASAARPRLTLGQSRRLGLGAPLSKMPDHTVQRSVDESAPLPLAPGMPAREPAEPSSPMPASSDQPGSAVSTEAASVPQAAIQRSAADSSAPLLGPPLQRQRDIAVQREAIESRPPPATPTDRERLDMPLAPTNQPATAGQSLQELSEPAPHQVADSPVQTSAARGIGLMPPIVQRLDASASDEEASEAESVQRRVELEHETNQAGSPASDPLPLRPLVGHTPSVQRLATTAVDPASSSAGMLPDEPAAGNMPVARLASSRSLEPSGSKQTGGSQAMGLEPSSQRVPVVMPTTVALLGSRPIRPMTSIQRLAESSAGNLSAISQAADAFPLTRAADEASAMRTADGFSNEPGRSLAGSMPSAAADDKTTSVETPQMAGLQRSFDGALAEPRQLPPLVLGRSARASVDRATAMAEPLEPARVGLPLAPVIPPAIQRTIAAIEHASPIAETHTEPPAMVQREESAAAAAPEVMTASSPTAASAAAPEASSDKSMDELATKLYDRIRARLKTELLVDRERAGFLTDLR